MYCVKYTVFKLTDLNWHAFTLGSRHSFHFSVAMSAYSSKLYKALVQMISISIQLFCEQLIVHCF